MGSLVYDEWERLYSEMCHHFHLILYYIHLHAFHSLLMTWNESHFNSIFDELSPSICMVGNQMCVKIRVQQCIDVERSHPAFSSTLISVVCYLIANILNVIVDNVIKFVQFLLYAAFELKTCWHSLVKCLVFRCLELQLKRTFFNFSIRKHSFRCE